MKPHEMEKAMLKNMVEKTGKHINDWIEIINNENFSNKSDVINFLKNEYQVGHFYAHLIMKKSLD